MQMRKYHRCMCGVILILNCILIILITGCHIPLGIKHEQSASETTQHVHSPESCGEFVNLPNGTIVCEQTEMREIGLSGFIPVNKFSLYTRGYVVNLENKAKEPIEVLYDGAEGHFTMNISENVTVNEYLATNNVENLFEGWKQPFKVFRKTNAPEPIDLSDYLLTYMGKMIVFYQSWDDIRINGVDVRNINGLIAVLGEPALVHVDFGLNHIDTYYWSLGSYGYLVVRDNEYGIGEVEYVSWE